MKLKDARTIDADALYDRRKQAVTLHQQGMKKGSIAPIVGVHRNTVGKWIEAWKKGGARSLQVKASGRPLGSGRTLESAQEDEIRRCLIDKTPEQLKLDFALWTRDSVRLLIRSLYGIEMPIRTVGEYLSRWQFTPQKPVRRAYERSPRAIKKWLEEDYPKIQRRAKEEGAEIQWGDETGMRSDDVNGRGYAPKGQTPVRPCKGTPEKVNMISTITNQGKVRFKFYHGRFNADVFIQFLSRLIKGAQKKVFLILDNLPVHHAKAVRKWIEQKSEKIEIFYLPSYSPELNPDEYLNNDLKKRISRKPDTRKKGNLKSTAMGAMRSIQKQPKNVRNYFKASDIQYAA